MGEAELDFRRFAALKDAFTESDLPFRVDLVDWATTSEAFRRIIERCSEVVLDEVAAADLAEVK